MKSLLAFIILITTTSTHSNECQELMRPFLLKDTKISTIKESSGMDITKYGLVDNIINRDKFERLYLQCMSTDKNQLQELAHRRFSMANKVLSYGGSAIAYTQINWQKPKNLEWFERLGFGLTFRAVIGKLHSTLLNDSGNRFQYIIKDYIFGRGATISFLSGFGILFGSNKADQEKIQSLKASATFKDDIKKLQEYANYDTLVLQYKKKLISALSQLDVINLGIGVHDGVDFNNLTPRDLEDEDIQNVVIAAILSQEYEQHKAPMKLTGDKTDDFFVFDSVYSIAKIPKDIVLNRLVDRVMCLNSHNVSRGLTQAIGLTVLNQILLADYYSVTYRILKKQMIDQ